MFQAISGVEKSKLFLKIENKYYLLKYKNVRAKCPLWNAFEWFSVKHPTARLFWNLLELALRPSYYANKSHT